MRADGVEMWRHQIPRQGANFPRGSPVHLQGAITGGAAYVGEFSSLEALRLSDGVSLWRHAQSNYRLVAVETHDGVIVASARFSGSGFAYEDGFPADYLLALRAADGIVYWQTTVLHERIAGE